MAEKESKEQHKSEIENIMNRLKSAGVQPNEKETTDIKNRFTTLTIEWRVPPVEAMRTVIQSVLRAHGIDTRHWATGSKAPVTTIDQIKIDNEWVSLKAKVVQIWENRSDKVLRTGLIGDGTGVIKFTIFARNEDIVPGGFAEGNSYLFENLVSSIWQGQVSVKANRTTTVTPCEDIEVSRREETLTGVITAITSGSGLIKRCPECNRALVKAQCGEHGRVDGIYDIRIKAVFSPFGTNDQIDLVVGKVPTEAVTNISVEKAKEVATEALDATIIEEQFKKTLMGRYFEVKGNRVTPGTIIVTAMTPVKICTQAAIAEVLREVAI